MTVFLAISGTLYQNFSLHNIAPVLPDTSAGEIANLIAGTSSQTYKDLSQQAKDSVIPQITDAMRSLWMFFLVGATLSFILSIFLGVSHVRCRFRSEYVIDADLPLSPGRGRDYSLRPGPDSAVWMTVSDYACSIYLHLIGGELYSELVVGTAYIYIRADLIRL